MNAVGLGAAALLVAEEISSGDAATIGGTLTGDTSAKSAAAFKKLGLMVLAVVILAVMASASGPWPELATVTLVGLAALWAFQTFGTQKKGASQ